MLAVAVSAVLITLGVIAIKYGVEAIIIGLTFLAIACGFSKKS